MFVREEMTRKQSVVHFFIQIFTPSSSRTVFIKNESHVFHIFVQFFQQMIMKEEYINVNKKVIKIWSIFFFFLRVFLELKFFLYAEKNLFCSSTLSL